VTSTHWSVESVDLLAGVVVPPDAGFAAVPSVCAVEPADACLCDELEHPTTATVDAATAAIAIQR
jgi:hypothetical protein